MKFATLSHLLTKQNRQEIPKEMYHGNLIVSPEFEIQGATGHILALDLLPQEVMKDSRKEIRKRIFDAAVFAYDELGVRVLQLGALTTSVTSGGQWLVDQGFQGYVTHGDSYTAAVTCQAVQQIVKLKKKNLEDLTLAVVGAYGIIGEAVSQLLVPQCNHAILIGRKKERFAHLESLLEGDYETTITLDTHDADVIVTATSHPTALLDTAHIKQDALIVDVSQPPNVSFEVCKKRPDILRVDGGLVTCPGNSVIPIPGLPPGKIFACFAEVVMQALENDTCHHVGSIDLSFLKKTEEWAYKYGFTLNELTNFGQPLNYRGTNAKRYPDV